MRFLAWRWRVRTMMVAVGMVALVLGGWLTIERRRAAFEERGWRHSTETQKWMGCWDGSATMCGNLACEEYQAEGYPPTPSGWHPHPVGGLPKRIVWEWMDYHTNMGEKYTNAADRPWLPVAADPPEPPAPSQAKPGSLRGEPM